MHKYIAIFTLLAGACDMPTDNNEEDLPLADSEGASESGGDESGDLPIVEPDEMKVGDYVPCVDLPDRTAYAVWAFWESPLRCRVMQFGLKWADINTPGFEADLLAQADANRAAWGIPETAELFAGYTFSDLTPDP